MNIKICHILIFYLLILCTVSCHKVEIIKTRYTGSLNSDLINDSWESPDPVYRKLVYSGIEAFNIGNYDASYDYLQNATLVCPNRWVAYYYLGLIADTNHEYKEALENLNKSLLYIPGGHSARSLIYLALGETNLSLGNYLLAEQHLLTSLNINPDFKPAQACLERLKQIGQLTN